MQSKFQKSNEFEKHKRLLTHPHQNLHFNPLPQHFHTSAKRLQQTSLTESSTLSPAIKDFPHYVTFSSSLSGNVSLRFAHIIELANHIIELGNSTLPPLAFLRRHFKTERTFRGFPVEDSQWFQGPREPCLRKWFVCWWLWHFREKPWPTATPAGRTCLWMATRSFRAVSRG